MDEADAKKLFREANVRNSKPGSQEVLDEDEFVILYFKLLKRPDFERLFDRWVNQVTFSIILLNAIQTTTEKYYMSRTKIMRNFSVVPCKPCNLCYSRKQCQARVNYGLHSPFIFKSLLNSGSWLPLIYVSIDIHSCTTFSFRMYVITTFKQQ